MSVLSVPRHRVPSARNLGRLGAASPPGFDQLLTGIGAPAQSAWASVQSQLSAENAVPGVVYQAQQRFMDAFNGLANATQASSVVDLQNVANGAATLVLQNNTVLAQGQLLDNLIQGGISGNSAEVVQALGGSLCSLAGAAIAAGTVSGGAGAALIIGIQLATQFLQSLFAPTPVFAKICGVGLTFQPGIVVGCTVGQNQEGCGVFGCTASQGQPTSSGTGLVGTSGSSTPGPNPFWRSFPQPTRGSDSWWFAPINQVFNVYTSSTQWTSNSQTDLWVAASSKAIRPIDCAFPQYHQLECDAAAASLVAALPDGGNGSYSADDVMFARFIMAYFGAWQANAEFFLNGANPQYGTDAAVLKHLIGFWNNTHAPGAGKALSPRDNDQQSFKDDIIAWPQSCAGTFDNEWWYVSMLLPALGVNQGQSVTINTGPKIVVPNTVGSGGSAGSGAAATASGAGTALLVTAGIAAAAAGGVYLYGRSHGMTFGQTVRSGWDHVRHPGRKRR